MTATTAVVPWGRYLKVVLSGIILLAIAGTSGWCYGRSQYDRGIRVGKTAQQDSLVKALEARNKAFRDSIDNELGIMRLQLQQERVRSQAAEAKAKVVEQHAKDVLTPDVVAKTEPKVLDLIAEFKTAN